MSHPHGHSCSKECDHGDVSDERGIEYSLYKKIDLENLECLNESIDGSGKFAFRPWEERLRTDKVVESDADQELLFNIPFTGLVKLKGIIVIGSDDESHPSCMKLYKNRPRMTFDDTEGVEPEQTFEMTKDTNGSLEYAPRIVKFSSIHHLTIYFPRNFGSATTKIYYIGLKGEFTEAPRQGIAICTYEAAANPADHNLKVITNVPNIIQ